MAHECPECGQVCYCSGDIDDICLNLPDDQARCIHYTQRECEGYEEKSEDEDAKIEYEKQIAELQGEVAELKVGRVLNADSKD